LPLRLLGIAQGALDLALAYSKERKTFGKPIHDHQAIAFKLADMEMKIEQARMLVYKAAWLKDQGMPYDKASAMAKLSCFRGSHVGKYRSCSSAWWLWLRERIPCRTVDA